MRRHGRVEGQDWADKLALARVRDRDPLLRGRIQNDISELRAFGLAAAKEKAIAAVKQMEPWVGHEVERGVAVSTGEEDGRFQPHNPVLGDAAGVEEPGEGLGELFAVVRVVDEAQPVAGDALEAA